MIFHKIISFRIEHAVSARASTRPLRQTTPVKHARAAVAAAHLSSVPPCPSDPRGRAPTRTPTTFPTHRAPVRARNRPHRATARPNRRAGRIRLRRAKSVRARMKLDESARADADAATDDGV